MLLLVDGSIIRACIRIFQATAYETDVLNGFRDLNSFFYVFFTFFFFCVCGGVVSRGQFINLVYTASINYVFEMRTV